MSDVTRAPGAPPPEAPPPELTVAPVEAAPGQATTVAFSLRNRSGEACSYALSVLGLEPEWVEAPALLGPVAPGATLEGVLTLTLPTGYPASTLVGSLSVRSIEAAGGQAAVADLVASVGDGSLVLGSLEPSEVHGWRGGRLVVNLRNRGARAMPVALAGESENARLGLSFEDANPVLDPASERRVAARIRLPFLLVGAPKRHPFGVRVQGRATPIVLSGAAVQRPLLSKRVMKFAALGSVAALWIGAAVVGITALSAHVQKAAVAKSVASSPPLSPPSTAVSGSGSGGASGGAGGSGGSGSAGGASAGPGAGAGPSVRIVGKVSGTAPGGVTVTITPTSLANTDTQGATMVGPTAVLTDDYHLDAAPTNSQPIADGKIYGTMLGATADAGLIAAASEPTMSTKTNPDGTWAIGGVRAPGTYLVTFAKAGFETQKYIVTTTSSGTTMTLNAAILPGSGDISGTIADPSGPLGGVTVTLTDGTVTLTTYTPSVGSNIGQWALTGLSTPGTYLVTATKAGYGTETTVVDLAASGSASGVDLTLRSGVGSITGTVVSARGAIGIGGVTVSATDGSTTESATTTTDAKIGSYTLPNLPIPGAYALTISGAGWVTQTRKVNLSGNAVVGASLTPSGADVIGFAYDASGAGLGAAGVVLANSKVTYKTLTQSTTPVGSFDFGQVPAGTYVLTIEDYGYTTASAQVVVSSGQVSTVDLTLATSTATSLDTGTIQGSVYDLFNADALSGIPILIDGNAATTSQGNGTYEINDVAPGVHTVSAAPTEAQGFEGASVQVNVPLGGTVVAPPLELPKLDSISGTVTSGAGTGAVSGASIVLTSASTSIPTTTTSTTSTTSTTTTTTTSPSTITYGSSTTGADGNYSFTDLDSGNYELAISATGYVSQTLDVSLAADEDLLENVTLTLEPAFNVVTYASASGGSNGVAQVGGICVTVSGPDGYSETQLSSASATTTFEPLVSGSSYTATFLQPSVTLSDPSDCASATSAGTAPSDTFTAADNNASVYSAIIAPSLPEFTVGLSFEYELAGTGGSSLGSTVDCPVVSHTDAGGNPACPILSSVPTVSLEGITSFETGTGGSLGTPVYSSAVAADTNPAGSTSDSWGFSQSLLNAQSFVSDQVTLTISGTGTPLETETKTVTLGGAAGSCGASFCLVLTPNPVTLAGTIGLNPVASTAGATLTVNPDAIPISAEQNASSAGEISVTASSGSLTWYDTQVGTENGVQPGCYQVTASDSGYASQTYTIDPGVAAPVSGVSSCSGGTLAATPSNPTNALSFDLAEETALDVSLTGYTATSGLALPTVYLLDTDGGTTTTIGSQQVSGTSLSTTFTGLLPGASDNYSLVVTAPGYQTAYETLTSPGAGPVPESVGMTEEAWITGTIEGDVDPDVGASATSPLAGVTVTATMTAGTCTSSPYETDASMPPGYVNSYGDSQPSQPTFSATTDSHGDFLLTGSPGAPDATSPDVNGGLCPDATYALSTSPSGYGSGSVSVTLSTTAGANSLTSAITVSAEPITQEIIVKAPSGSGFLSNALPNVSVGNSLGSNFVCPGSGGLTAPTDCPSSPALTPSSDPYTEVDFSITVYPTAYTYAISAPGFEPLYLSTISYTAGTTPAPVLTETLFAETSTVTGTVTTGSPSKPVPGLLVDLYAGCDTASTTLLFATTNTSGVYTVPGVPTGTYCAAPATSTGYSTTTANFSTDYPATTTDNLTVSALPLSTLDVTVTTSAADANLGDATVELVETGTVGNPTSCTNSSGAPLLVPGLGESENFPNLSGSGPSYQASFLSVVPDYYELYVVTGSDPTAIPDQTMYATDIEVCPSTNASDSATVSVEVEEGELSGDITITPPDSSPTLSLSVVPLTATATTIGSCDTTDSDTTCPYTIYGALGVAYSASVSLAGYTPSPSSIPWSPTMTTPNQLDQAFTLDEAPTITDLETDTAPALTSTAVTIDGTGFISGGTTVYFGNVEALSVTFVSSTQITAYTPTTADGGVSPGDVDVEVSTAVGDYDDTGSPLPFSFT